MVTPKAEPGEQVARIQLLALKYIMLAVAVVLEQVPEEAAAPTGEAMEAALLAEDLLVQLTAVAEAEPVGEELLVVPV
jgi:hypothetical protein